MSKGFGHLAARTIINIIGYGAFAAWIAAVWIDEYQTKLGMTGLIMFILSIILATGMPDEKGKPLTTPEDGE